MLPYTFHPLCMILSILTIHPWNSLSFWLSLCWTKALDLFTCVYSIFSCKKLKFHKRKKLREVSKRNWYVESRILPESHIKKGIWKYTTSNSAFPNSDFFFPWKVKGLRQKGVYQAIDGGKCSLKHEGREVWVLSFSLTPKDD